MGYTKTDIIRYYEARGEKPPSRPTISKYYDMDVVPDDPGAKLAKLKTFDSEPFRSTILRILETNSGKSFCMSSVYDVLEEKFIENGTYDKLPGNEQTLRNYIHYLEDSGQVNREPEHRRVYDYVFDTPPGEQMLIDFCFLASNFPHFHRYDSLKSALYIHAVSKNINTFPKNQGRIRAAIAVEILDFTVMYR